MCFVALWYTHTHTHMTKHHHSVPIFDFSTFHRAEWMSPLRTKTHSWENKKLRLRVVFALLLPSLSWITTQTFLSPKSSINTFFFSHKVQGRFLLAAHQRFCITIVFVFTQFSLHYSGKLDIIWNNCTGTVAALFFNADRALNWLATSNLGSLPLLLWRRPLLWLGQWIFRQWSHLKDTRWRLHLSPAAQCARPPKRWSF